MAITLDGTTGVTAAEFDGTIDASNLTGNINASQLTGALPAIDGSALIGLTVLPSGGDVGSYALLCPANNASVSYVINTVVAGSSLEWNGTRNGLDIDGLAYNYNMGSPTGTWRLCQPYPSGVNISVANLIWLRIS